MNGFYRYDWGWQFEIWMQVIDQRIQCLPGRLGPLSKWAVGVWATVWQWVWQTCSGSEKRRFYRWTCATNKFKSVRVFHSQRRIYKCQTDRKTSKRCWTWNPIHRVGKGYWGTVVSLKKVVWTVSHFFVIASILELNNIRSKRRALTKEKHPGVRLLEHVR